MMRRQLALLIPFVLLFIGCDNHKELTIPKVYPVHGKILFPDGKPLPAGIIILTPKNNTEGAPCQGAIEEDGSFSVRTFTGPAGAVPGKYLVSIEEHNAVRSGPYKGKAPLPKVPAKFLDPTSSELQIEVKAQENNDVGILTLK